MNPERLDRSRRTIRLRTYDYMWAGAYFVTIVVQNREPLLGEVTGGEMRLSVAGRMVLATWLGLPGRFGTIRLDAFVVMPDHIHGIIVISDRATGTAITGRAPVGAGLVPARGPSCITPTLGLGAGDAVPGPGRNGESRATTRVAPTGATVGDVVGAFKSLTTVAYADGVRRHGWPEFRRRLWQRNYYEHIVRDEEELWRIRGYIRDNPARWTHQDTLAQRVA